MPPKKKIARQYFKAQISLGHGASGQVYLKRVKDQNYAVKTCDFWGCLSDVIYSKFLCHPHLIEIHNFKLLDEDSETPSIELTMDMAKGDMRKFSPTSLLERKWMYYQIISGLAEMHSRGICHYDVKPANILIFNLPPATAPAGMPAKFRGLPLIKVTDLGHTSQERIHNLPPQMLGSPLWNAPEVLLNSPRYNCLSDMWSVGIMLLTDVGLEMECESLTDVMKKMLKDARKANSDSLRLAMVDCLFQLFGNPYRLSSHNLTRCSTDNFHPDIEYYYVKIKDSNESTLQKHVDKVINANYTERYLDQVSLDPLENDLIQKLLTFETDHTVIHQARSTQNVPLRISAKKALAHPYFNEVRNVLDKMAMTMRRRQKCAVEVRLHNLFSSPTANNMVLSNTKNRQNLLDIVKNIRDICQTQRYHPMTYWYAIRILDRCLRVMPVPGLVKPYDFARGLLFLTSYVTELKWSTEDTFDYVKIIQDIFRQLDGHLIIDNFLHSLPDNLDDLSYDTVDTWVASYIRQLR